MPDIFFRIAGFAVMTAAAACAGASQRGLEVDSVRDQSGCELEIVVSEPGMNHYQYDSFDREGTWLAVGWDDVEDRRGTFLLNLKSGEKIPVPKLNNGATFSPDGKYLLNSIYVENGKTDIALLDRQSGELKVLAPDDQWDWLPSFSSDGTRIIFNSFRTGNSDVYLLSLDSGEVTRLTDSDRYEAHAQLSPDGETVMFHRQDSRGDYNIYLLDLDSGAETQITDEPTEESYASWSPDGRFIAFASDRGRDPGKTDLYVMTRTGEVVRRLTDAPEKDAYPFWSPDGNYLYFNSYREPKGIYRMSMSDLIDCKRGAHISMPP